MSGKFLPIVLPDGYRTKHLVVIDGTPSPSRTGKGYAVLCFCEACGETKAISTSRVAAGQNTCGCAKDVAVLTRKMHRCYEFVEIVRTKYKKSLTTRWKVRCKRCGTVAVMHPQQLKKCKPCSSCCKYVEYRGSIVNAAELAARFNLSPITFRYRLKKYGDVEKALHTPKGKARKYIIDGKPILVSDLTKELRQSHSAILQKIKRGATTREELRRSITRKLFAVEGRSYGALTILKKEVRLAKGQRWHLVHCSSCGKDVEASHSHLKRGLCGSCLYLRKCSMIKIAKNDITLDEACALFELSKSSYTKLKAKNPAWSPVRLLREVIRRKA